MTEHVLFVTGKLAEKSLARVLTSIEDLAFNYEIRVLGISVAALLTAAMIKRRLDKVSEFDRIVLPGRCRGDLGDLASHFGVPFERGPEELKDLPAYFGAQARPREVGATDVNPICRDRGCTPAEHRAIIQRAQQFQADGADVIDIGCLPDTPFAHMEETITSLKQQDFKVSIDSLDDNELMRGISAGADFVFSLTERTLDLVADHPCTPVLSQKTRRI